MKTVLFLAAAMLLPGATQAQACPAPVSERPRIGLALGGGGARGAAHIGVLKALEDLRVPVDVVAGTSMGSVIGGLYAAGMSATEIETAFNQVRFDEMFTDQAPRTERRFRRKRDDDLDLYGPRLGYRDGRFVLPDGALVGQKVNLLLQRITLGQSFVRDFDRLPIPFRAVAADLVTGQAVVLQRGDLARAMRASMSIPGVFWPVEIDDQLLVDGGIANNLPVSEVRELGADVVIAVDVHSPRYAREELTNLFDMVSQLTNIMVYNSTRDQLALLDDHDVLLTPGLGREVGSADFDRLALAIPIGQAAVDARIDRLRELALSEADYAAWRARLAACARPLDTIAFVELNNSSDYSDEAIVDRLHLRPGQVLDYVRLERDIDLIYGLGQLREVSYRVERRNGQPGVIIDVLPDRRAPNLIEYGLTFFSNARDNAFNLRAALLKTDIDRMGGEWRTLAQVGEEPTLFSELYKPLSTSSPYYMTARVDVRRDKLSLFESGNAVAEFLVDRAQLELTGGKEFGNSADLAVGLRRGAGDAERDIGDTRLSGVSFDTGQAFARFRYDHVDDLFFPNTGGFGALEWRSERDALGASQDFDQLSLQYYYNWTLGRRHHVLLGAVAETTLDEDAPIYGLFRAGGFGRLSGLEFNQIAGQHLGIGVAGYRYSVGRSGLFPAYLGGTLEAGNVWDDRDDISLDSALVHGSLYFGYRSPLGPLYVGLGFGEGGEGTLFVRLGSIFRDD